MTFSIIRLAGECGDCVVVINTKHVAMRDEMWRTWKYFHHTGYVLVLCGVGFTRKSYRNWF